MALHHHELERRSAYDARTRPPILSATNVTRWSAAWEQLPKAMAEGTVVASQGCRRSPCPLVDALALCSGKSSRVCLHFLLVSVSDFAF